VGPAALLAREAQDLSPEEEARFSSLVAERQRRRPLQHIVGTQAFYGRDFTVTPDVLIPRPETELLVEAALDRLPATEPAVVVDIGTGSGCIALTLAAERPDAEVARVEFSHAALECRGERAAARPRGPRVVSQGDLLSPSRHLRAPSTSSCPTLPMSRPTSSLA
jgi:release factor glutamine methyltransferase